MTIESRFTIKYKADRTIKRYKICLIAKGFIQTYVIDYTETFALVAKLNIVIVLLSFATNLDCPIDQLDIKNVFFNGELEEKVFTTMPLELCKWENIICKLKKSLRALNNHLELSLIVLQKW